MEKTLKDYILECDLYPYSKENFDLMKECAEIDLMARYLENVEFIESGYGSEIKDAGYFQESVSETEYQAMTESLQEKVKNVGNTIAGAVKKVLSMLRVALDKVVKALNKITDKLSTKFGKGDTPTISLDADGVQAINNAIQEALDAKVAGGDSDSDLSFKEIAKISPKQTTKVKIQADKGAFKGVDKARFQAAVNAVFTARYGSPVMITPLNNAVDPEDIIAMANDIRLGKDVDDARVNKLVKHTNRVAIPVSTAKMVEALKNIQGSLASNGKQGVRLYNDEGHMDAIHRGNVGAALLEATSATIKLLNGWVSFYNKVGDAIMKNSNGQASNA